MSQSPDFLAGVRAGLRIASHAASQFSVKANRNLHPDVPWDKMSESAKLIAHMIAQCISAEIAAIDPVTVQPGGENGR